MEKALNKTKSVYRNIIAENTCTKLMEQTSEISFHGNQKET